MTGRRSTSTSRPTVEIRPQVGPQETFLSTSADIAIYGGSAGGGKSWALLLEALRHSNNPQFAAVFFRRTTVQVRNPGGLWDESVKLFGVLGAKPRNDVLEWRFPGGGKVKFAHLEHESNVLDWQGAQVPLICFDELTHFTETQFFYMLSRNRSMCGVRPYVRATCNPDADSWVASFIGWWIDQQTGYPIPERAGRMRWFVRISDTLHWADRASELTPEKLGISPIGPDGKPLQLQPKSVTFIPATLSDNKALMEADPGYLANLMALPTVQRERLLGGNWKVRGSGDILKRSFWQPWTEKDFPEPTLAFASIDTAFTEKEENDCCACTVWYVYTDDLGNTRVLLRYAWRERLEFNALVVQIEETRDFFKLDKLLIEAKANGISVMQELRRRNPRVSITGINPTGEGDKVARAHAVTSIFGSGSVFAPVQMDTSEKPMFAPDGEPMWRPFASMVIDECAAFPKGATKDITDTVTQALNWIRKSGIELYEEDAPAPPPVQPRGALY
ncbi:terminase family protein (plasmid) [Azospirillum sp. A26]|uniref:terminase large subunit domain-containing protein n=1 Tax=Azospirillum sp. A26 TaxID=3160607 RepID=UPI0036706F13